MLQKIIDIVQEVDSYITEDSDMEWTNYKTGKDLKDELARFVSKLSNNDLSCLEEVNLLFAPTSDFQELSLTNGWSKEYIIIANRFDNTYNKLKKK